MAGGNEDNNEYIQKNYSSGGAAHAKLNIDMNDSLKLLWNTSTTKLLISEYKKRLEQFRNPKIKKKSLWEAIAQIFRKIGYNITVQELDCKMRNIKHHYKTIKDNNKNKTGRGRIVWEYYDIVDELFLDDKTINHGKILNSMEFRTNAEVTSSTKATAARGLYRTRVEYLETEKRRVTAIENLVKEISENNNIQKERNELLRKYLGENSSENQ
ncbi:unnamed protein product [Ceutorhynchus assimilis]|uniref:Myb/SANT-like DNA-binding domain-containing protein n=1 Tax=Ceutorhynchus assimilis TaxID=467358 RepID=A0A9N9N169_9CUCU|nr:unnamed protein product [Ceutorhynchus assimilis]